VSFGQQQEDRVSGWRVNVVAYRFIWLLWRDRLGYIVVQAKREVILVRVQQAAGNMSHWGWTQGRVCVRGRGSHAVPGEAVQTRARRRFKIPVRTGGLIG